MKEVYLAGLCRTAIGNFGGTLKDIPAADLGKRVIQEALHRAGVKAGQVEEVLMGNVLTAGQGQNPARQAAMGAGIPMETPAATINKVCGSGLYSVTLACRTILAGDAGCMVAGGMESMSQAPYLVPAARWGVRLNHATMADVIISDGLEDAFHKYHMGITAENIAQKYGISRLAQDEYAALSQSRGVEAAETGRFEEEIVALSIPQRKGEPITFAVDEYPRKGATTESLAKLRPAFAKENGTVTAGNASGINDGAAAMVVCSGEFAQSNSVTPIVKIVATASAGVDPALMGMGPVPAIGKALDKAGLSLKDIGLFELNEAFAAQACAVTQELGLTADRVNVNGGAIALGHPIGASGARILVTLAYEMKRRDIEYGIASLCIGGGMGEAIIVRLCR